MKTKAIVFTGIRQIEVSEVQLKPLGSTDVLVETYWSSISTGTEKMAYNGLIPSPPFIFPSFQDMKPLEKSQRLATMSTRT